MSHNAPRTSRHSQTSRFNDYAGRVMCGYQGWFRAPGDGMNEGWGHYSARDTLDVNNVHMDFWPDVSEYPETYATPFTLPDGSPARLFSSTDASTVDVHFRWMQEYGIDGVFVQRFFSPLRTCEGRLKSRVVLEHALAASREHDRAVAVMYDLSGLRAGDEDCAAIIADWRELVDQLRLTSAGDEQTYLYHRGKPLVAIWGLGFPDRPYDIRKIGIDRLIDFLKNDPVYGGCSVVLGVPAYFRELHVDCLPDPYLHELIAAADVVLPWNVQRYTPLIQAEYPRFEANARADLAWCVARGVDYVPCVTPGFSWHNLARNEFGGYRPLDQIPRQKGEFYWGQISAAKAAGATMLYVAMFDEMDEGTAIFKCANVTPTEVPACNYEGQPTDEYLRLTGEAGRLLRGEIEPSAAPPAREAAMSSLA